MSNEQLNTPNDRVAEERKSVFLQPAVWMSLLLVIGTLIYCSSHLVIPNLADWESAPDLDPAVLMLSQWLKMMVYAPLALLLLIFVVEHKKKTLARSMLIFALVSSVLMLGVTRYISQPLPLSSSQEETLLPQEVVPEVINQSS